MPPPPPLVRSRPPALVDRENESILAALALCEGLKVRTGYTMEELGGAFGGWFALSIVLRQFSDVRVDSTGVPLSPAFTFGVAAIDPTIWVHMPGSSQSKRFIRSLHRRRVEVPCVEYQDAFEYGRLRVLEEGDTFTALEVKFRDLVQLNVSFNDPHDPLFALFPSLSPSSPSPPEPQLFTSLPLRRSSSSSSSPFGSLPVPTGAALFLLYAYKAMEAWRKGGDVRMHFLHGLSLLFTARRVGGGKVPGFADGDMVEALELVPPPLRASLLSWSHLLAPHFSVAPTLTDQYCLWWSDFFDQVLTDDEMEGMAREFEWGMGEVRRVLALSSTTRLTDSTSTSSKSSTGGSYDVAALTPVSRYEL